LIVREHGKNLTTKEISVSLPRNKADEILEFCLSKESPEIRAKIYEVISLSGVQPNDPMFLVLALTGQIRVLLEIAPVELRELLGVWKAQVSESMKDLHEAIALVQEAQKLQIENIKQSVGEINSKNVDDICILHKSLVSEILSTNTEVENSVRESSQEITNAIEQLNNLNTKLQSERSTNIKVMKALIEGVGRTTKDLELASSQIDNSIAVFNKLKLSKIWDKWVILGSLISVLLVISLFIFGLVKMTKVEQSEALLDCSVLNT